MCWKIIKSSYVNRMKDDSSACFRFFVGQVAGSQTALNRPAKIQAFTGILILHQPSVLSNHLCKRHKKRDKENNK